MKFKAIRALADALHPDRLGWKVLFVMVAFLAARVTLAGINETVWDSVVAGAVISVLWFLPAFVAGYTRKRLFPVIFFAGVAPLIFFTGPAQLLWILMRPLHQELSVRVGMGCLYLALALWLISLGAALTGRDDRLAGAASGLPRAGLYAWLCLVAGVGAIALPFRSGLPVMCVCIAFFLGPLYWCFANWRLHRLAQRAASGAFPTRPWQALVAAFLLGQC